MIFQRALRRELTSAAGATFTVLFSIFLTWTLIGALGMAAGGKVASGDVLAMLGFAILVFLPIIVTLTGFISVLAVVTRSYRDSEMVVWFASGLPLTSWIRPVLQFGLLLVMVVGTLSLVVTPWARMKKAEFIHRFEKRDDLERLPPGQFRESASSNRVFFVEGTNDGSNVVRNVFVNTVEKNGNTVVVAKEGVIEADGKGGKLLVLKNGRRYQGIPGQANFQSMEFERYSMRVATKVPVSGADQNVDAMSTRALLTMPNPSAKAELLYRISAPIMFVVLIMLAIPLGFVNPRAGSSVNLILALLIFFTYTNLSRLAENSVKMQKLSFAIAWWPLHLFASIVVLALFAWRLNVNHRYHPIVLFNSWKRRRGMIGG